jgi:hypothetical protein
VNLSDYSQTMRDLCHTVEAAEVHLTAELYLLSVARERAAMHEGKAQILAELIGELRQAGKLKGNVIQG